MNLRGPRHTRLSLSFIKKAFLSEAFGAWSGDYRKSQNREWVQAGSPPARDKGVSGLVSEAEESRGIQEGAEGTCFIHSTTALVLKTYHTPLIRKCTIDLVRTIFGGMRGINTPTFNVRIDFKTQY